MTPAVVCNPSVVDDVDQLRKAITARCATDPLWFETTREDPGAGQVRQALDAGADLVLVCGGDGTVAACAGALAATDERAKAKAGWLAYLAGAARALRRPPQVWFTITVDGAAPVRRQARGVLVGNVGQVQGGLRLLPDAQPDDGVIDIGLLMPRTWRDWPILLVRILQGRVAGGRQAEMLRGQRVDIEADQMVPTEYDGDYAGEAAQMTVRVLPRAISVCVRPS